MIFFACVVVVLVAWRVASVEYWYFGCLKRIQFHKQFSGFFNIKTPII